VCKNISTCKLQLIHIRSMIIKDPIPAEWNRLPKSVRRSATSYKFKSRLSLKLIFSHSIIMTSGITHKLHAFEQDLSCIGALQMLIVLYCIVKSLKSFVKLFIIDLIEPQ